MNKTVISERLAILEPDYKAILLSDFPSQIATIIQQQTGVSDTKKAIIENGIMLYFLLFFHKYQLVEFLISECGIPIKKAFNATEEFIQNLPASMVSAQVAGYEKLERTDEIIKEKNRYDTLNKFTLNKKYFYLYIKTVGLFSIAKKYDLHKDEMYKKFATTVGDIILGFYRIEDTVPLLQQELEIDPRTAAFLGADVLDFLAPLSDPNWQPPTEETEKVDDTDTWASDTTENEGKVNAGEGEGDLASHTDTFYNTLTESYSTPATSIAIPTAPVANGDYYPTASTIPKAIPTLQVERVLTAPPTPQPGNSDPVTPVAMPATAHQQPTVAPYPATPNAPLHTMAGDMYYARTGATPSLTDDEPTYRSQSQDALRQPLSTVPTYTPVATPPTPQPAPDLDPPRWSSQ